MASHHLPVERTIVLVGLMGAGKTCIGRLLALELGLPFVDADEEVTRVAGSSIEEIFRRYGESAFREGERRIMARLLDGGPRVLASGGGAFIDPETHRRICERAISVWLRAELDVLIGRTMGRTGRPLLNVADPRAVLEKLIGERYPIYTQADIIVDTTDEPKETTVGRILRALTTFTRAAARTTVRR
jgi:shikimate kinase